MNTHSSASQFSVQLDGVTLGHDALQTIGDEKLAAMRDNADARSKFSGAMAVYGGFVSVMNVVSSVVASVAEREDYLFGEPASRIVFGAMTAAASLFTYKYYRERALAKSLDQAVVLLNGDTQTAKYKSTADALVKKELFTKEKTADTVVYHRLTP